MGSVALRESWLIDVASWLPSWCSRGVVLFLATVQKQGKHVPRQNLALQCCWSPSTRSGGSPDSCPKTQVSVSKLASACGVHAWLKHTGMFILNILVCRYLKLNIFSAYTMKNPFIETKSNWRSKDCWPEMKYFKNKIYGDWIAEVVACSGVPVG